MGTPIETIQAHAARQPKQQGLLADIVTITIMFQCGSMGTVHYFSNGSSKFPKERVEVFCGGQIARIDNFRVTEGFAWAGLRKFKTFRQDKGQAACVNEFVNAIKVGGGCPISLSEIMEVSHATLSATECLI